MTRLTFINSVASADPNGPHDYVAGESYEVTDDLADDFVLKGYAIGGLSRDYAPEDVVAIADRRREQSSIALSDEQPTPKRSDLAPVVVPQGASRRLEPSSLVLDQVELKNGNLVFALNLDASGIDTDSPWRTPEGRILYSPPGVELECGLESLMLTSAKTKRFIDDCLHDEIDAMQVHPIVNGKDVRVRLLKDGEVVDEFIVAGRL